MRRSTHLSLAFPAPAEEVEPSGRDRRTDTRLPLCELPWLSRVRLKYGPDVSVVDLSRGGAQIETEAHRLQPGSTVVLEIASEDRPVVTIPAHVLRCQIASITPQPIYRGGLSFKREIDIPAEAAGQPAVHRESNPLHEHARLTLSLNRRFDQLAARDGVLSRSSPSTAVGADALSAALAMLNAPAGRQAGSALGRELSRLFSTVTAELEQDAAPDAMLRTIADRLRRVVPVRVIRLVEGRAGDVPETSAMCFDVPSDGERSVARLLVDVWPGAGIEDWHLQYLTAAAHILGVVRQLQLRSAQLRSARARTTANPPAPAPVIAPSVEALKPAAPAAPAPLEMDLPSGWHRVVIKYLDGRMLKGYSREFAVSSSSMPVWPKPDAPPNTCVSVPLGHLKAVFFVRDFDGDPTHLEGAATAQGRGRLIAVTFLDGETLVGTTLNYNPDAIGFFMRPVDAESNNARVFVGSRAIRHVQFPRPQLAAVGSPEPPTPPLRLACTSS